MLLGLLHVQETGGDGPGFGRQVRVPVGRLLRAFDKVGKFAEAVADVDVGGQGAGRVLARAEHLRDVQPEQAEFLLRFGGKVLDGGGPHLPDGGACHPARHDEQGNDDTQ